MRVEQYAMWLTFWMRWQYEPTAIQVFDENDAKVDIAPCIRAISPQAEAEKSQVTVSPRYLPTRQLKEPDVGRSRVTILAPFRIGNGYQLESDRVISVRLTGRFARFEPPDDPEFPVPHTHAETTPDVEFRVRVSALTDEMAAELQWCGVGE